MNALGQLRILVGEVKSRLVPDHHVLGSWVTLRDLLQELWERGRAPWKRWE